MKGEGAGFWSSLPLGPSVELLTHDRHGVAAFAKPAGVLSHPNESGGRTRSLLAAGYDLEHQCYEWSAPATPGGAPGERRRLWLLNRLDAGTSGVILVAAGEEVAGVIRTLFQSRHVSKTYVALVFGRPAAPVQTWKDLLDVSRKGGVVRTSAGGGIPSECRMKLAKPGRAGSGVSLLRLEPKTGRSHQLRVQCAKRGLPIVGDQTYGDFSRNREFARRTADDRLFLHSMETSFSYVHGGRENQFKAVAPVPAAFAAHLQ